MLRMGPDGTVWGVPASGTHEFVRAAVTDLVHHRLVAPDGSCRFACSEDCADRYLGSSPSRADYRYLTVEVRINGFCGHCGWCATRVVLPDKCLRHEDCPDFDPLVTLRMQRAVRELRRRSGCDLPPRAFEYLTMAAHGFRAAGVDGTAALLIDRVWDARVDWQPA